MQKPHTILLAEDCENLRNHLVDWIGLKEGFQCIGTASDGVDALEKILKEQPDIALLDISMPKLDGLEVLKALSKEKLHTRFIVLSLHYEERYIKKAIEFGCSGYVHKSNPLEIWDAVLAVLAGDVYFSSFVQASD